MLSAKMAAILSRGDGCVIEAPDIIRLFLGTTTIHLYIVINRKYLALPIPTDVILPLSYYRVSWHKNCIGIHIATVYHNTFS